MATSVAGSALAEDGGCPKVAVATFAANNGWQSLAPEAAKEIKILAIGSSSTWGIGASDPKKNYPAQLQARLAERFGNSVQVTVENAGVNGEQADLTEERMEKAVETGNYDVVVWQVGTNDALGGVDPAAFKKRLIKGIAAVKRTASKLVILDPQFFPGIADIPRYESYVSMLKAEAAANNIPVFQRYETMKSWAKTSKQLLASMLFTDEFHMSDRGYSCVAETLAENIATIVPGTVADNRAPASKQAVLPAAAKASVYP